MEYKDLTIGDKKQISSLISKSLFDKVSDNLLTKIEPYKGSKYFCQFGKTEKLADLRLTFFKNDGEKTFFSLHLS